MKITTEDFINKSIKIHGNKYDYSLSNYITAKTKVKIICPIHGVFEQTPDAHTHGKGCRKCGKMNKKTLTKENVIKDFKNVHGDRYNYDKMEYVHTDKKVIITCKIHGDFLQSPHKHKQGNGCSKCGSLARGKLKRLDKDEFVFKAKKIHKKLYDYSKVIYKKCKEKVCIVCKIHGEFYQTPDVHLQGSGCPKCRIDSIKKKNTLTKSEFIERSIKVHGEEYDYSKVNYTKSKNPVNIICSIHGSFYITPDKHMNGSGCPVCRGKYDGVYSESLANKYKDVWKSKIVKIYLIKCWNEEEEFFKVGITSNSLKIRFGSEGRITKRLPYYYKTIEILELNKYDACHTEIRIKKNNKKYKYTPKLKFDGYTECFNTIDYWEGEFNDF